MKIQISFSKHIVGLLLGVLLAAPLLYASIALAPDPASEDSDFFGVEIVYAYLERQNTTLVTVDYTEDGRLITEELDEPNVRAKVVLNVTRNSAILTPNIAEFWVYQVEFYTDKCSISNVTYNRGILFNSSVLDPSNPSNFASTLGQVMNFSGHLIDIYGGEDGGSGASTYWPIGHSVILFLPAGDNDWVSAVDQSETLFVRVKELGWAVFGDSTEVVVLPEPNVIAEVQLEPYGDGFMHNTALSEEQLSEIELLDPAPWDFYK